MAIADIRNKPIARTEYLDRGCAVCIAINKLPEDEAAALVGLLSDPSWRYEALSKALSTDPDNPLNIDAFTLSRHARGICAPMRRQGLRLR